MIVLRRRELTSVRQMHARMAQSLVSCTAYVTVTHSSQRTPICRDRRPKQTQRARTSAASKPTLRGVASRCSLSHQRCTTMARSLFSQSPMPGKHLNCTIKSQRAFSTGSVAEHDTITFVSEEGRCTEWSRKSTVTAAKVWH